VFPFNLDLKGGPGETLYTIALTLMTIVNFCMAVFWIIVGWRAMKAHERLPDALAASLRAPASAAPTPGAGESR